MLNYCVINGVNSNTVHGLIIRELPPISKPLMRTEIEEIDGRDGDIVTNLGYSAYDKEMTIGLHGDFDIDDAIRFFDSSGTVTFSNEVDKFYFFQIVEQIDFERLARFRTATVKFHVQPFKYSAVDLQDVMDNQSLYVGSYSSSQGGINVRTQNNNIVVSGTATKDVAFYVPLDSVELSSGTYTLYSVADGTGSNGCWVRVVRDAATDEDSFGGRYVALSDGVMKSISASISAKKYNWIWLFVPRGTAAHFTVKSTLSKSGLSNIRIFNRGNIYSRPIITVYGSGTVNININGTRYFTLALDNLDSITLDGRQMDAYTGDTLRNRAVTGDYDNLVLKTGTNVISWSGNVSKVVVEESSRWI